MFSDGSSNQIASLTANSNTGGYDAYFEVTINGSGASTGIKDYEGETGGHFKMGQNFPNPHHGNTTIPFTLSTASDVKIDLYDLNARKVATINKGMLTTGDYKVSVDLAAIGLAMGDYIYQLETSNSEGVFRQCKMMTAY